MRNNQRITPAHQIEVIVSLQTPKYQEAIDIEIPAELPASMLVQILQEGLSLTDSSNASLLQIYADPPGRLLLDHESLADVGAWDGSRLQLKVSRRLARLISEQTQQEYQIIHDHTFLGRRTDSDQQPRTDYVIDLSREVESEYISRRHALLHFSSEGWMLEHLSTATNETYVNEQKLTIGKPCVLSKGDTIRIGAVVLHFYLKD